MDFMDGPATKTGVGYIPGPDFEEDNKESLIDIEMNEDTELWLIQLPNDQLPDFEGQKISLELDGDGPLGTIEGKSGKEYTLVNYPSTTADITVFLSSPSGPKIGGKICRHVSLVHYPDPKEVIEMESEASKPKSHRTPHLQSRSRSTLTSKRSSAASEVSDGSKHSKRTSAAASSGGGSRNHSAQHSDRGGRSDVTFSGSSDLSHRKKKRKISSDVL